MAEDQVTVADIAALQSERDGLRERLRQAELNLLLANRTKSEFLTTMSHELRTPLNAIIGFAEILLDPEMPVDEETKRTSLENIRNSGWHLLRLINEILDLSKVDLGDIRLDPQEFHLLDALQGVHTVIRPLAEKKRQRVELLPPAQPIILYHDVSRFKQVMHHLLSNAVKFTPEQGHITTIVYCKRANEIEVAVTDTGIGIREEDQGRIFEAFEQGESGYSRSKPGTGLGLSLVQRLARLMGGEVWVCSAPHCGSTFTLLLPLRQEVGT